jgi:hypothetical protein
MANTKRTKVSIRRAALVNVAALLPIDIAGLEAFHRAGLSFNAKLRERRQASPVDARLYIAVPDTLEIDHRRGDVAVSHPLL